jgi:hypothetical protein
LLHQTHLFPEGLIYLKNKKPPLRVVIFFPVGLKGVF